MIKKRVVPILLILLIVLFLTGCTFVDNFVGEAGRRPTIVEDESEGMWLVFELDSNHNIENAYTQKYDKEQKEFFDRTIEKIPPQERGLTKELIIKQGRNEAQEYFSNVEETIYEDFKEDGTITFINSEIQPKKRVIVKIAINGKINPKSLFEVKIKDLETGKEKTILSRKESYNLIKKIKLGNPIKQTVQQKSKITGRFVEEMDETICENLKEIIPEHNNDLDTARTNVIFMGFGYPVEKNIFEESLPYYLDFSGNGITYQMTKKAIGVIKDPQTTQGLFYHVPFNENKDKFNLWYVDNIFKAYEIKDDYNKGCNCVSPQEVNEVFNSCQLPNQKIVILCYDKCRGGATIDGLWTEIGTKPGDIWENYEVGSDKLIEFIPPSINTAVHELGHTFGGLYDEYYYENSPWTGKSSPPNCAATEEVGISWWQDIFPNLELFSGCSYSINNYRFSEDSIMKNSYADSFGNINQLWLCYKIFKVYGQVSGEFCESFFSQEEPLPVEICDDNIDNNNDGKIDCYDKTCIGSGCSEICDNKFIDEDLDGKYDCADIEDCNGEICGYGCVCGIDNEKGIRTEVFCEDNMDNDYDDQKDCKDSDCWGENCPEECFGDGDEDGDGLINCDDQNCIEQGFFCINNEKNIVLVKLGKEFEITASAINENKCIFNINKKSITLNIGEKKSIEIQDTNVNLLLESINSNTETCDYIIQFKEE